MAIGTSADGAIITSYTPRSNENYAKGVGVKAKTAMQGLLTSVSGSEGPKDSPRRHFQTDKGRSINSKSFNVNRGNKSPRKNYESQDMPSFISNAADQNEDKSRGYMALPDKKTKSVTELKSKP